MHTLQGKRLFAVVVTIALHGVLLVLLNSSLSRQHQRELQQERGSLAKDRPNEPVVLLSLPPPAKNLKAQLPTKPVRQPANKYTPATALATQAAPMAPTAQEWAFAASYTLKNSKAYRYNWSQQVRSMMGTAVAGANTGAVRFLIEIAPSGQMTKLQTLWSTSDYVEKLARSVMQKMPALPPTPTGKPLVFEKTISFSPYSTDYPPLYKDDCLPDIPSYRNPFTWDGQSPQQVAEVPITPQPSAQELADCKKNLPQDSFEAESAFNHNLYKRWGAGRSGN